MLVFGDGAVKFRPVASLDAVGHEFGHGITDFQIGWGITGDPRAFHEGLSDIWGAILEYRIKPNSVWKMGEQIDLSYECLRNLQNTNDNNARTKIADTYGTTQYNNGDPYVRSGVFSHWFYLLVNGGSETNGIGNSYIVNAIGMDKAEDIIVEAVFNNYLDNTTSYSAIRTAMINATQALFCANSKEVQAVTNAWFAVGVGTSYSGSVATLSGNGIVCTSQSYIVVNQPSGISNITWSSSNTSALTVSSSGLATRVNNYNGIANIYASLTGTNGCAMTFSMPIIVGSPTPSISARKISSSGEPIVFRFTATSYNGASYGWYVNDVIQQGETGNTFDWYFPCNITKTIKCKLTNSCGTSAFSNSITKTGGCDRTLNYSVSPNPASSTVTISTASTSAIADSTQITYSSFDFVRVFDFQGNLKKSIKYSDANSVSINVANLQGGSYIFEIGNAEYTEKHQVIIHK